MFKYIMAIVALIICFYINTWFGIGLTALACIYMIYSMIPSRYAAIGNKAYEAGDNDKARIWYEKAYKTGRANAVIKMSYAFILMRAGEFETAEMVLNALLSNKHLKPEHRSMGIQYRCMVYYRTDRLDEALDDALELFETYKNTAMYGMIGFFKILKKQPQDEVRAFCEEAYDYNSEDRDILDNISLTCYEMGDYESAKKYSDELLEYKPKFIEAYYHAALICEKLGQIDLAREHVDEIENCRRSAMTTISEEEIIHLKERLVSR